MRGKIIAVLCATVGLAGCTTHTITVHTPERPPAASTATHKATPGKSVPLPSGICAYRSGNGGGALVMGDGDACGQLPPSPADGHGGPWTRLTSIPVSLQGKLPLCALTDTTGGVITVYDMDQATNDPTAQDTCNFEQAAGWSASGSQPGSTPSDYTGSNGDSGPTVNVTCTVTDIQDSYGDIGDPYAKVTVTNPAGNPDISISDFNVAFFNSAGQETGTTQVPFGQIILPGQTMTTTDVNATDPNATSSSGGGWNYSGDTCQVLDYQS